MNQETKLGLLCACGAVLIWSGFILVSRQGGISALLAYDVIAIRYLTCALLVLPVWATWQRFNLLEPRFVVSALIGGLAYALFAFHGFELSPASHAAVLLPGALPLVITFLSAVLFRETYTKLKWLGVVIITSGMGILFWHVQEDGQTGSSGHLYLFLAACCWGMFTLLLNRWQISPWQATISLALVTSIVYLPIYWLYLPKQISEASLNDIMLQAFYQGLMATIIQMLLYVHAVRTIGAASMGSLMACVPIIAGFGAVAVFSEPLSIQLVIALLLVSMGITLANSGSHINLGVFKINLSRR